ncbi:MAG: hypothetical protein ABJ081_00205 [Hyphomicrobiales bacterium]
MEHVHIVGISPRTGTTLLAELMTCCFEFDGWAAHELNIYYSPKPKVARYCSKNPRDLLRVSRYLKRFSKLWVLCMVRDPRDIIVSRHRLAPDTFWSNLGIIEPRFKALNRMSNHPRFITVHYEDLVTDPDKIQAELEATIPFLQRKHAFSSFEQVARPAQKSLRAMNGLRAISTDSINRWKNDLPRVKAQIERYSTMDEMLQVLGYETNNEWHGLLDKVKADNGKSYHEDRCNPQLHKRIANQAGIGLLELRAFLGVPKAKPIVAK